MLACGGWATAGELPPDYTEDPMSYNRVLGHAPTVRRIIASNPDYCWIEADVLLAIMVVESAGDLNARRAARVKRTVTWTDDKGKERATTFRIKSKAQYSGPFQQGHYAGLDVGMTARRRLAPVTLPDGRKVRVHVGWDTTDHLRGDLDAATHGICQYMVRYQSRHNWDPRRMAVLWKAGPGSLRTVNRLVKRGTMDLMGAVIYAQRKHDIPRADEYLRRFDRAYARITRLRADQNWRQLVASAQTVGEAVVAPAARWARLLHGALKRHG